MLGVTTRFSKLTLLCLALSGCIDNDNYYQDIDKLTQCLESVTVDMNKSVTWAKYGEPTDFVMRQKDIDTLEPEDKLCVEEKLDIYAKAFGESCQIHGCGEDIGGGCAHLMGGAFRIGKPQYRAALECGVFSDE